MNLWEGLAGALILPLIMQYWHIYLEKVNGAAQLNVKVYVAHSCIVIHKAAIEEQREMCGFIK